ncbi:MAG: hypothetical protein JZD41_01765, partial [Thermoproteus sp.]|nr:hypothetical protein [Thermoproteus sp.]
IYPNPRAERKYAAVLGGTEVALAALYRLDPTIVPDYLVYDPAKFGIVWDGVVDSGFFDSSWS